MDKLTVEPYRYVNIGSILSMPLKDTVSPTGMNADAYRPASEVLKLRAPGTSRKEKGEQRLKELAALVDDDEADDGEPQWKKTWRQREAARLKTGITLEREQLLLDEQFAEMNFGEFRNEADRQAKLKKYRDLHDRKLDAEVAASLKFLGDIAR